MSRLSSRTRSRSIFEEMIGVPASSASLASLAACEVGGDRLVAARLLLQPRDRLLDGLQVSEDHLGLDRGDVGLGVHLAVDMGDVLVAEDPSHLADRCGLANVREELVAQPLPLRGALDDAGDVDELDGRGKDLGGAEDLRELAQPIVGYADHAHVRLDGREGVVRRQHVVLGQGVEQGRLARVGETDDSDGECHGRGVYGGPRPTHESSEQRGSRTRDRVMGTTSG